MATPAQAAAATVGAGSLAAAGAYGVTQAVKGSESEEETTEPPKETPTTINEEPEFKTLNEQQGVQTYSEHTLGHNTTNKPLLIDYKNTENKKWWDWAFKNKFEQFKKTHLDKLNDIFKTVNKNYDEVPSSDDGSTQKTSLNYACHKAYGLKWYDFTSENNLLENTKLFCSKGLEGAALVEPQEQTLPTPVLLSASDSGAPSETTKFGGDTTKNKALLVAAVKTNDTDKAQENWWKWVFKKHFLAKKKETSYTIHAHFEKVVKAYSATAETGSDENNETALNQACNEVYQKTLPITGEGLESNLQFFCTKDNSTSATLKITT